MPLFAFHHAGLTKPASSVQCSEHWFTPDVLSKLTGLTHLVVECNGVEGLDLHPLQQLRELSIVAEGLTDLPPGISQLSGLTALDVSWNRLETLPTGPYLSGLRRLSLAHNSFQSVPPELVAATALEVLDLTGCSSLGPGMHALAVLAQVCGWAVWVIAPWASDATALLSSACHPVGMTCPAGAGLDVHPMHARRCPTCARCTSTT